MKKTLLATSLLATSFLHAQDHWNNNIPNGFNSQTIVFDGIKSFKNNLYIVGDSVYNYEYSKIFLYSSPTGINAASYKQDTAINSVLQGGSENRISSMVANSNYLFFGSSISNQGTKQTPQVYRYDGTSYQKYGIIDYSILPVNNAIDTNGYSTPYISNMVLLPSAGGNDTIYAFLNPGSGSNNLSVWKAPATTTGTLSPTWINASNPSVSSGITTIYDAIVWNNSVYVAINSADSGGMIVRTTNGVDWENVLVAGSLGSGYSNGNFTALEIYKGKLVAGFAKSSNTSNYSLWYAKDSVTTSSQQWYPISGSNAKNTYSWAGINDLQTANGKLWIQAYTSENVPTIFNYTENAGDSTIIQSSLGTGLEINAFEGMSFKMESFNNAIYSSGINASAGQRTSNSGTHRNSNTSVSYIPPGSYGSTWMFNQVNPTAGFIDSIQPGGGFCANSYVYLRDTSVNGFSADWYINNTYSGSGETMSYLPQNAEVDTIKMITYNGTNQSQFKDSLTRLITIHANPTVINASASYSVVCQGQLDTLKAVVTGGAAPYTYAWYDHYGSGQYGITLYHIGTDSNTVIPFDTIPTEYYHNMYVTVTDANHCSAGSTLFPVYVNPADSLSGLITSTSNLNIGSGQVYLFKQKTTNVGDLDTTAVYTLGSNGRYTFPSLYYGNYYIKAVANTSSYPTAVGTYYSNRINAYQWDSALVIQHHTCTGGNDTGTNIKVIQITPPSGHGIITGFITKNSTYGMRLANNGLNQVDGAPLKGIDVKLGRNPGGGCAGRTKTDSITGAYTFTNVDTGSYHIFVDIPNYGMDSIRAVTVTIKDTASINNNYYVDSTMVRVLPTNTRNIAICFGTSIKLGGLFRDTAGIYYDTLQTANKTDSLVITTLTIKKIPHVTIVSSADSICAGNPVILTGRGATSYVWSSGGIIDSTITNNPIISTTYTVTGTTNGCSKDTMISIKVNQLPLVAIGADKDSVCTGASVTLTGSGAATYTWNYGIYTASITRAPTLTTTYSLTGTDLKNCENTATKTIKVNTYSDKGVIVDVALSGAIILVANAPAPTTYQWINCNNNNAPISGATSQSYTATISGSYAVVLVENGCKDTSVCNIATITTGIVSFTSANLISIYPNPTNGVFTIETNAADKQTMQMFDITGKLILSQDLINGKATIDAGSFMDGIYNINIIGNGIITNKRLVITR